MISILILVHYLQSFKHILFILYTICHLMQHFEVTSKVSVQHLLETGVTGP
jgi:hypothetical protein